MEVVDVKQKIINTYLDIVKEKLNFPTYTNMKLKEISKDSIKAQFGNLETLHTYMKSNFREEIEKYFLIEDSIFGRIKTKELKALLKTYKKFVITTAISGMAMNSDLYDCLKSYCKINNALLLIIPCANPRNKNWTFSPALANEVFITEDTSLNSNLFISSIMLSAKQIKPTTGLVRIGHRNGSYVFGSPKQFLEFVVTDPDGTKLPSAIFTTGAITNPEYLTNDNMTNRTSYIASVDHTLGAVVIEIENNKEFHFRQLQLIQDSSIVDLGIKYYSDGHTDLVESSLVMGDFHAGKTDKNVLEATDKLIRKANVRDIYLHDFFDGYSITDHDNGKFFTKGKKQSSNKLSLELEIKVGKNAIEWILSKILGKIYMIKGNHDERLDRYVESGRYLYEPQNYVIGHKMAIEKFNGKDLAQYVFESELDDNLKNRIVWFDRRSKHKIMGIELSQHGDKGMNGAKASLDSLERAFGNCVVGHTHSGCIMRGVYRVGSSTEYNLDYNDTQGNWSQTHCLVYDCGARQLINIVGKKCYLEK